MPQKGAKIGTVERISTLKGWARGNGKDLPISPKPAAVKPKKVYNKPTNHANTTR